MTLPMLPLRAWVNDAIGWINAAFGPLFHFIGGGLESVTKIIAAGLMWAPPYLTILVACLALVARGHWRRAATVGISLLLIWNLGFWDEAMVTIALVVVSGCFALLVGIPLGIVMAESEVVRTMATPILDYMQTTPAFVYLIPTVLFFGIGSASGIVAPAIFATPPTARALLLAIQEVDPTLIEAGNAFGSSRWQLLVKLKLPTMLPYIYYSINQCIMMALAMVIMASLVGAGGLGSTVIQALGQADLALGIESGAAVVLVAIVLDRLLGTS